jgi:nicotinate-nucleotide adenylyltransferase
MRTLVFGGSFNPLHHGHLRLAVEALEAHDFAEVWLMPSGTPPHRARYEIAPEHRLEMTRLACASHRQLDACGFEVASREATYTVDTVRQLRAQHPDRQFSFLTGIDAVYDYRWKNFDELLQQLEMFLTASRPGYDFALLMEKMLDVPHRDRLRHLPVPLHEVSSSLIRERLKQERSIHYWVPEPVREYIARHQLYRGSAPGSV